MRDWSELLTQLTEQKLTDFHAAGYWGDIRLCHQLDAAAERDPDRVAVVDRNGRTSYRELAELSRVVAAGLAELGVEEGDLVAWQLPNRVELIVLVAACSRLGAVFNALPPIFREREVSVMLGLGRPTVLVTVDSFRGFGHAKMMTMLRDGLPSVRQLVVIDGEAPEEGLSWSELLAAGTRRIAGAGFTDAAVSADAVAQLAFTSGTTGEPKGVLHTHNTLLYGGRVIVERRELESDGVYHMASTLGHQTGMLFGVLAPIRLGATIVLQDVWDAGEYLDLVESEGVTMTNGATPFLQDTLEHPEFASRDLSSVRQVGCFGSGFPTPLAIRARRELPEVDFYGIWGMTEVGLGTSHNRTDPLEVVSRTDGIARSPIEVRILSDDLTTVLGTDEVGEMVVRGPSRHVGFLQPGLAPAHFLPGDWYVTGDRGCINADGYLVMSARSKDIIIRGGENIPVVEVEDLLLAHPDVYSVAVVAVPDERLGERACACVVLRAGASFDVEDLRGWLREHQLTPHFWPEFVRVYDEFPVTPSGKIKKFTLREQVADLAPRSLDD